jgi:hypothetical protein
MKHISPTRHASASRRPGYFLMNVTFSRRPVYRLLSCTLVCQEEGLVGARKALVLDVVRFYILCIFSVPARVGVTEFFPN